MNGNDDGQLIIESVREDGRRFRPSDWIERISATLAQFGSDHRLHYATAVHPCVIEGQKCLVVAKGLERDNPAAYAFILGFARENQLRVQEDRRSRQESVTSERRSKPAAGPTG